MLADGGISMEKRWRGRQRRDVTERSGHRCVEGGRVGFIVTVQLRGKVPGWAWLVGWLPAMLHSWSHDGDAAA